MNRTTYMKTLTAPELKKKLENNDVFLIDIRQPSEYKRGYIEGAFLLPLQNISVKNLSFLNQQVVLYCHSGKRSREAAMAFSKADPALDIASLEGGIQNWIQSGQLVEKSLGHGISLERQAQIFAGTVSFLGVLLGKFVHPLFYILPAFVGAGLILTGLTGWCGMMKVLSKMSWNRFDERQK